MKRKYTLPYPPSANRYWRTWHGHNVLSEEAREYKRTVALKCRAMPIEDLEVKVTLEFYRPRKVGDLDNRLKPLLDSLQGIAFNDDNQVSHIVAIRRDDKENPRVEVTVEVLPDASQG